MLVPAQVSCPDANVSPGLEQIQHSLQPGIEQTEASTDEAVSVLTHAALWAHMLSPQRLDQNPTTSTRCRSFSSKAACELREMLRRLSRLPRWGASNTLGTETQVRGSRYPHKWHQQEGN